MSFKNFSENISNTISELKDKNYNFSNYKKFSLSYLLILILVFSFLIPGESSKVTTNINTNKITTKTNKISSSKKVVIKKTLQDKANDALRLSRKCKSLVPKFYQKTINRTYYNNIEFADKLKKYSIKGPNDSGWNTITDRTYNVINIMRNAGADC